MHALPETGMTLRALLFAPLLLASAAALAADSGFVSGVWRGEAHYDQEGKFQDCTMTAESERGVLLGFIISKDFTWGLVLADEGRALVVGAAVQVTLLIDAREPVAAVAKVVDPHGILIPLENSEQMLEALRQGKVLTIVTGGVKVSFNLTGTSDAIAELAACVTDHLDTEKI
jgi:hypothetical protein